MNLKQNKQKYKLPEDKRLSEDFVFGAFAMFLIIAGLLTVYLTV